ncbi:ChaN family lipoprotein [Stutzerimonas stutzeri]|uniref:Iron(III) ABC transporter n=1 Tax=Stutzerimonas stutzeri TaxID=316 RepID=A0A2N8SQ66_STUST|nr:ChaN family lipoprotein [Stutzerimonas stutzeri]MCQ4250304.1 ChaN family lipoprotein [Stutzerimonas stutzeri]PNG04619.1 iron(III) ABC transporter [Stutzerimonas stutzeri]QUE76946.1 ChaN family lipoprotein [Stutzerimonas stutzeri]
MKTFSLIVLLLLAGCQSTPPLTPWQSPEGRDHADLGRIIDLRTGETLSAQRLVTALADADQVLVGERHDNPDHHSLQRWLLEALAQRRAQGSLLMEMIDPDQQASVAQAQASIRRGVWPEDLPAALQWQRGWSWELYAPVIEYALAQPYPLLSANLDRSEIKAIYRDPPTLSGLAAAVPVQSELLAQIRVSHCDKLPETQLPAMLAVQQQRDRRMAERLQAAPKPALLFAGAFHVRRDLGVPLHMADSARHGVQVLMLAEVGEDIQAEQADFVWFTPAQTRQDVCAQFGERAE